MWKALLYESAPIPLENNIAAIYKVSSDWNDFGYKFQAGLRISVDSEIYDFSIRLLPFKADIPQPHAHSWIDWIHETKENPELRPKNKNLPSFITILSTAESYQKLHSILSSTEEYESLLQSINEINSLHESNKISRQAFDEIINTAHFKTGVTREAHQYMAFRFGYYSARKTPPPSDARISFNFSTLLPGFSSAHELRINYIDNDIFSDRIHCLIGINGCGKTRLLRALTCTLNSNINRSSKVKSTLHDCHNNEITDEIQEPFNDIPLFSRVISYSSDPHNILPRKSSANGPFEYIYSDMGLEQAEPLTINLADLIRSDVTSFIDHDSRYTILKKSLQDIVPLSKLLIPLKEDTTGSITDEDGKHWIPIGSVRGGEQRKLEIIGLFDTGRELAFQSDSSLNMPLSSGQKMYFRFATHFLNYVRTGTLVIIDEPETHLHPNLITSFMNLLYAILNATSSAAIIATHSAYVAREAPSHCVHVIKGTQENEVSISNIYGNTLGANISFLSNFVFGDATIESFNTRIAKYAAQSGLSFEEIAKKYSTLMSMDMLMKIREIKRQQEDKK